MMPSASCSMAECISLSATRQMVWMVLVTDTGNV